MISVFAFHALETGLNYQLFFDSSGSKSLNNVALRENEEYY
jgi:hypothetical protein